MLYLNPDYYFIALHFLNERLAASSGVSALAHDVNNTTIRTYKMILVFISCDLRPKIGCGHVIKKEVPPAIFQRVYTPKAHPKPLNITTKEYYERILPTGCRILDIGSRVKHQEVISNIKYPISNIIPRRPN